MSATAFIEHAKTKLLQYDTELQLDQYAPLNLAHEKTKLPRIYIALGAILLVFLVIIQVLGISFVSNCFAFVPIYSSFKALRTPGLEDDEYWLTYWVVYGTLSLFESFIDGVFFWLPFYFIFKIVFLIWAYHPQYKGALVIYQRFLGPIFIGVEKEVEEIENSIRSAKSQRKVQ